MPNKIQRLREKHNLTQSQFARKIGASRQAVWNWENTKRVPGRKLQAKIMKEFMVAPDFFWDQLNVHVS